MNKLLKKTLKIILPILLGGFILYWVYRDFDFSKAEEVLLHQTNWWWMLLSLFFGVMSHVLRGWRWKQTLEPLDAHPKTQIRHPVQSPNSVHLIRVVTYHVYGS